MNYDDLNSVLVKKQPTLFEGLRQTMTEAIALTTESMNVYGPLYDHWVIAYSGGKDSSCVATLIPQLIANGNIPAPKSLTILYAELKKPHNRLRKPTGERTKAGVLSKNQNRMGPLTMEARRWGMRYILEIQEEVNVGARACGDPEYLLITPEEQQVIEHLIESNTWPQKWSGKEPIATQPFEEMDEDGWLQGSLICQMEAA